MFEVFKTKSWPKNFGFGFLMGAADAIPGVSGGTIALILGIYYKFIKSISSFLFFFRDRFSDESKKDFLPALNFLLPLGIGMLFSYYILTKILVGPDESPGYLRKDSTAPFIYSFFFGLVLSSIREPWKLVSDPSYRHYMILSFGIIVIYSYSSFSFEREVSTLLLVVGGLLAITAMLLPGVSGALVLLSLGLYTTIASSFHDGDFEPLFYLICGGLIGLLVFVPFMNFMLQNHLDYTMSLLTGFMAGSLIPLWPWKEDYASEGLSSNLGFRYVLESFGFFPLVAVFLFFLGGILMSYGLKELEKRISVYHERL